MEDYLALEDDVAIGSDVVDAIYVDMPEDIHNGARFSVFPSRSSHIAGIPRPACAEGEGR